MTYVPGVFEILEKEPQNITVSGLTAKTYGDAPFSLTVTPDPSAHLSAFSFDSSDPNVAEINSAGQITVKGGGTAVVTVTEPGDADYAPFVFAQTLTVAKADLRVAANDARVTYGDDLPAWTMSYAGFVNGDDINDLQTAPGVSLAAAGKITAGTHALIPADGVSNNYNFVYTNGTFTVDQKNIAVSNLSVFDKEYAGGDTAAVVKNFGYTLAGVLTGDDVSINIGALTADFEDGQIGDGKTVTIGGIALIGDDIHNYILNSNSYTTAGNIRADLTARDVADAITGILSLPRDARAVVFPNVPGDFTITIKSSDSAAIDVDGQVRPVDADTPVTLVFTVTKTRDESAADTGDITVVVPESTRRTITFDANGGSVSVTTTQTSADGRLASLPVPVRSGSYRFDGWYTAASDGTSITTDTVFLSDATVYARWTYVSGGGGGGGGGGGIPTANASAANAGLNPTAALFDKNHNTADYKDVAVTLTKNGNTLTAIRNGGYTLKAGTDYTVNGDIYTIRKEYLETLSTGVALFSFDMSGGASQTLAVTVKGAAPGTEPNPMGDPFADVTAGDWFYGDVAYVYANALMGGTGERLFSPRLPMTRGMFVTVLYRLSGEPAVRMNAAFGDNEDTAYYYAAVNWAAQYGVVSGVGENLFAPGANITRQDMAVILARYADFAGIQLPDTQTYGGFLDEADVADYAKASVTRLYRAGIIGGKSGNLLDPRGSATRAECAAILHRYVEKTVDK
jgi:hypothetical protein